MPGTYILTGATGGMASLYAHRLATASPDSHLILLCRSPTSVKPGLLPPQSDLIVYLSLEMKSLANVRSLTSSLIDRITSGSLPSISGLICSAAIQVTSADQPHLTPDGYEETMAVNHLTHYLLIRLLLPHFAEHGRIVVVGSDSHWPNYKFFKKGPEYEPLGKMLKAEPGSEKKEDADANGKKRYANSKLAQTMIGHEVRPANIPPTLLPERSVTSHLR